MLSMMFSLVAADPEKEMVKRVTWMPVSDFEVLSIWADCCRHLAQSYRDLSTMCKQNKRAADELGRMAEVEEARYAKLAQRVNELIERELAVFYANGGKVLEPQIKEDEMEAIRPSIEKCLASLREHEQDLNDELPAEEDVLGYAKQEKEFYNTIFAEMASLYPFKEVKQVFRQLYEE